MVRQTDCAFTTAVELPLLRVRANCDPRRLCAAVRRRPCAPRTRSRAFPRASMAGVRAARPTVGDVSSLCGAHLAAAAADAVRARGAFTVALSGGSLPRLLAEGVPADALRDARVDLWTVLLADERVVPLDHEDSNYRLIRESFPQIPEDRIVPIARLEDGHQAVAADYAEKVERALEKSGGVFDVVYLGLGPDGHTASLFPGHELLKVTDGTVVSITDSPKPPPERVTLTLPVINAARSVAFVCTGEGKAKPIADIFENPKSELPGAKVLPASGNLDWFVDAAAASGIGK